MFASLAVGAGLCGWVAICLLLSRAAERRATRAEPPMPWVPVALAVPLVVIALVVHPNLAAAAASGVACIALVVAAWADARTGFIFDALTLPAGALAASLAALSGAGGEAAAGVTLLVGTFGALVVFSRGRWMGLGDVKAMYALGAAFGPTESLVALLAACACGIVAAAWHGKLQRGYEVLFGPHLAAGAAFALAAGAPLVHGIMGF